MSRAGAGRADLRRAGAGPAGRADPFAPVRPLADAVLYEGYVLYPYRASAAKNRNRWQFGVLVPPSAGGPPAEGTGLGTSSGAAASLLVEGVGARVRLLARFLQVQSRSVEAADASAPGGFRPVGELRVGSASHVSWDEAVEHELDLGWVRCGEPGAQAGAAIDVPGGTDVEELPAPDAAGRGPAGRLVRRRFPLAGSVRVEAQHPDPAGILTRLSVEVDNRTDWDASGAGWDETTRHSIVALHLVAAVEGGRFLSLLDPPDDARQAARTCTQRGLYPVLAGEPGDDLLALVSPIILYDHPELAPESTGDFFDATEIDEMLTLRVLTMTDAEQAEARATDPRAAAILDRCAAMPDEVRAGLHGAVRSLRPVEGGTPEESGGDVPWWDPTADASYDATAAAAVVGGAVVGAGTTVRLVPRRRADAQDMFVAGRLATVTGVHTDVDGEVHLAVVVDDDPAAELHDWYGRYLYFRPDEVELVAPGPPEGPPPGASARPGAPPRPVEARRRGVRS